MITKITNTPNFYSALKYQNRPFKAHTTETEPEQDTVSFTSRASKTKELVDLAFNELAKNRSGNNLGYYIGTVGKTNVHMIETELGKKAELSLMRKNEFANFELTRSTEQQSKIKYNDNDMSSSILAAAVDRLLNK